MFKIQDGIFKFPAAEVGSTISDGRKTPFSVIKRKYPGESQRQGFIRDRCIREALLSFSPDDIYQMYNPIKRHSKTDSHVYHNQGQKGMEFSVSISSNTSNTPSGIILFARKIPFSYVIKYYVFYVNWLNCSVGRGWVMSMHIIYIERFGSDDFSLKMFNNSFTGGLVNSRRGMQVPEFMGSNVLLA